MQIHRYPENFPIHSFFAQHILPAYSAESGLSVHPNHLPAIIQL